MDNNHWKGLREESGTPSTHDDWVENRTRKAGVESTEFAGVVPLFCLYSNRRHVSLPICQSP